MDSTIKVGSYNLSLPDSLNDDVDIVHRLMSMNQEYDSINTSSGRLIRTGVDTFKVIVDDAHIVSAVSQIMVEDDDRDD